MADTDDDDEFGLDDALDELPSNALYELERDAFLSTQQQKAAGNTATNVAQYNKSGRSWQLQKQDSFASDRTVQANRPPSDYGLDDEDVIDLDEQPYAVQQAYSDIPTYGGLLHEEHGYLQNHDSNGVDSFRTAAEQPQVNIAELQERILQLENDRVSLQRAVEEAKTTAQSKAGEAAIVRQKAEKAARDYDQKVSTLRQLHAEEFAKQKAEIERVKNEREKVATDNRFLEHDLVLEAGRARQVQRARKSGGGERSKNGEPGSASSTPKRGRMLPFRDGFDDDDLVMLSPSKKSKPSTPKAGGKRKRVANDQSPMPPLQLPLSEPKPPLSPPRNSEDSNIASDLLVKLSKGVGKLRFMQNLLSYKVLESHDNVFEALAQYAFPSAPEKRLSSLVYDQLSIRPFAYHGVNISSHFCDILISLWAQCLEEKYYHPIMVVVDTIQFVVDSESFAFARTLIEKAVPLAIASSDIVAIPIARASINKGQSSTQADADLAQHINVLACLGLLYTLAQAAAPFEEAITRFWRHMKFDFVLLMLMKAQPLPQITVMLQLLQTSALVSTFGAILGDDEGGQDRQARRESDTIDRLTLLLFEKPKLPDEEAYFNSTTILGLRLEVLAALTAICVPEHGGRSLASHRHAIGRLFKFLHEAINSLYEYNEVDHDLKIRCVNTTMRLIYYLITNFSKLVDVRAKLSVVQGGAHMHLIALTRLAFSDRVWLENGIDTEVMDAAHQLLDEYLSPDEGEALLQMFSSGNSEG